MMTLQEFDKRLWAVLTEEDTQDYIATDTLHNGLMTKGRDTVARVGFGVSDSLALYQLAVEKKCDLVIVHHGLPLGSGTSLNQFVYNRLAFLIKNNLSLWSAHYTLDAHSTLGNNAQMVQAIGATPVERSFFEMEKFGAPWGWIGEYEQPKNIEEIFAMVQSRLSPDAIGKYPIF